MLKIWYIFLTRLLGVDQVGTISSQFSEGEDGSPCTQVSENIQKIKLLF